MTRSEITLNLLKRPEMRSEITLELLRRLEMRELLGVTRQEDLDALSDDDFAAACEKAVALARALKARDQQHAEKPMTRLECALEMLRDPATCQLLGVTCPEDFNKWSDEEFDHICWVSVLYSDSMLAGDYDIAASARAEWERFRLRRLSRLRVVPSNEVS